MQIKIFGSQSIGQNLSHDPDSKKCGKVQSTLCQEGQETNIPGD